MKCTVKGVVLLMLRVYEIAEVVSEKGCRNAGVILFTVGI